MVIGDTRHSRKIFSLWSEAERNAIGIYEIIFDNSNKQDEAYYTNTNQSFAFADGVVTVELKGSCSGCPSSIMTLKQGVQNLMCHYIPEVKSVEAI